MHLESHKKQGRSSFISSNIFNNSFKKDFKLLKYCQLWWVKDIFHITPWFSHLKKEFFMTVEILVSSPFGQWNALWIQKYIKQNTWLTTLQRHDNNLFYGTSKFWHSSSITLEVLITVQKHLFKLILKSIFELIKAIKI